MVDIRISAKPQASSLVSSAHPPTTTNNTLLTSLPSPSHRRALARLQEEVDAAQAERAETQRAMEVLVAEVEAERSQQLVALEEVGGGRRVFRSRCGRS